MNLTVLSFNYKHTPVALRERLAIAPSQTGPLLHEARQDCGLEELLVLSTCNRVEFYHTGDAEGGEAVLAWMLARHPGWEKELAECAVTLAGSDALLHLFRVAASLESMVIGEPQILGQVKEGWQIASREGTLGSVLGPLLPKVFHAAKRVRSETGIAMFPVSVSSMAADMAGRIFESLEDRTVLVIGAGEMAELVVTHLQGAGVRRLMITNRTFANAVSLAERFHGSAVRIEHMLDHLADADIIISSTGSQSYVIDADLARQAHKTRKGRPMFFIDIAVPRDIDPAVGELSDVYCYDIDDLQSTASANQREREAEADKAHKIVEAEVERYLNWQAGEAATPAIRALRRHFMETGRQELERTLGRLPHLSDSDEKAVRRLVDGLLKKLLHAPSTHLKSAATGPSAHLFAQSICEAFGVDPASTEGRKPTTLEVNGPVEMEKVVHVDFPSER